jgi:hypothetical protein
MGAAIIENNMVVSKEIKFRTIIDRRAMLFSPPYKEICTPMFIAALVTIAKTQKQLKCPLVDE